MNLYRISLYDPFDRLQGRIEQHASSPALALLVAETRLRDVKGTVSVQIDLVGDFDRLVAAAAPEPEGDVTCPRCRRTFAWSGEEPDTCLLCGFDLAESRALHSVRAEEYERQEHLDSTQGLYVEGPDMDAVARLEEFSRGLGEIDGGGE